jgi:arylsulfatase A-like enzyme
MFERNYCFYCSVILVLMLCAFCPGAKAKNPHPNVVIILADDMGYGDPQCYNAQSLIPTPNIDRLARGGTRFTDAHSVSAVCTPTRFGLLTGSYCWRTPLSHAIVMPYEPPIVENDQTTLPEIFKQAGYTTGCIGKWHLGLRYPVKDGAPGGDVKGFTQLETHIDFARDLIGGPVDHGFDYFFGSAGCTSSDPPYAFIRNRRTIAIPTRISPKHLNVLPGFYPGLMDPSWDITQVDVELTNEAVGFIEKHAAQDAPMFLYFALNTPHIPWQPPASVKGKSRVGPYGDMILLADWAVGRVLDTLDKQGIADETLVIFSSDNGPPRNAIGQHACTGPFRGQKNTIFEGGHRVPFIVRWPGKVQKGKQSDQLLCLVDMMASFADLLNVDLPDSAAADSFSVLDALLDWRQRCSRPAVINDTSRGDISLRQGNWKYVQIDPKTDHTGSAQMLFNLKDDPAEQRDLARVQLQRTRDMQKLMNTLKSEPSRSVFSKKIAIAP